MSVRDGLLAILSIGPAYGSQVHAEFASRAPHRRPVNVGQIYQTLDRLTAQKLVEPAGNTDDGLPLYRLTPTGERAAAAWMSEPTASADWTEMLDQVLIASSIDDAAARRLIDGFRSWWADEVAVARSAMATPQPTGQHGAAARARLEFALAAVSWLEEAEDLVHHTATVRPFALDRPRRGRRPATATS